MNSAWIESLNRRTTKNQKVRKHDSPSRRRSNIKVLAGSAGGEKAFEVEPWLAGPDPSQYVMESVDRSPGESESAVHLYMREVGRVPLLSVSEEVELAKRIKRGDGVAREHMIRANLRLVVKIAREYEGMGLPLLDLVNEGNIGLMKAVEKFDPAKGAKFSTYSSWWIKQSMRRGLANQSKTIRLPSHVIEKLCRLRRAGHKLQELLGREPTNEELAAETQLPAAKVSALRQAAIRPASLEMSLGDDETGRLADLVPDETAEHPYERLDEKTTNDMLREFMEQLEPREARILRYRFGLDGGTERTLEEVGRHFGVTRERIRQLQNVALLKLRKMIEAREAIGAAA
jgi:RNA polymerase primary sigma factor